jgi:hypothetical protein
MQLQQAALLWCQVAATFLVLLGVQLLLVLLLVLVLLVWMVLVLGVVPSGGGGGSACRVVVAGRYSCQLGMHLQHCIR